jgi:HlyD family secretion protein
MRKGLRILLAASVLTIVGWLAIGAATRPREVWLAVERRDLLSTVPTEGELEAVHSIAIGPPTVRRTWNFQISMLAEEGSRVESGQPVVAFDTTQLRQRLQQVVANRDAAAKELEKQAADFEIEKRNLGLALEEARAHLRRAEIELSGGGELIARSVLAKAEIDRLLAVSEIAHQEQQIGQLAIRQELELAIQRSRLEASKREVLELESGIDQMTVVAPRQGTVILTPNWQDQKKSVGDQVWRMETILEIADLTEMRAWAEVDETAAAKLAQDQVVTYRLDAYPDHEYRASVAQIRRTVQRKSIQNPVKVVRIELALEATDAERMRPGMRFRGEVLVERLEEVLVVPSAALSTDREGTFAVRSGLFGQERVALELGRRDQLGVEVLAGLDLGDRVLRRVDGELE